MLYSEFASACVFHFSMVGVHSSTSSRTRSSRMMEMTTPAGPMFFCAPPYMTPYFVMSTGSDRKHDDTSATRSLPLVLGSVWNFVP